MGGVNIYGWDDNAGIGGAGGAGIDIGGADGEGYLDPGGDTNSNGGGGGGGTGRVRINASGACIHLGLISPGDATAACSEGLPPSC
jgi:hypothetical protein